MSDLVGNLLAVIPLWIFFQGGWMWIIGLVCFKAWLNAGERKTLAMQAQTAAINKRNECPQWDESDEDVPFPERVRISNMLRAKQERSEANG